MIKPSNYQAWAVGRRLRTGGFKVRRVLWGLTLAQIERRPEEEVRAAQIEVERDWKPRHRKATEATVNRNPYGEGDPAETEGT